MRRDEFGAVQADLERSDQRALDASHACPFSDESDNEDALAAGFAASPNSFDSRVGYFDTLAAGRITDEASIYLSSSGGLTSWLLKELLSRGLVDGILHVGRSDEISSSLFEYTSSGHDADRPDRRKSIYYSTTMADLLAEVAGDGRSYALVGVPCFIKAANLLMQQDESLRRQIRFRVGLVCGHLKTPGFAECLAWQAGVPPEDLKAIDFRMKKAGEPANQYSFAAQSAASGEWKLRQTNRTLAGNWGHGMFQLNSCNFCDDIFAETADICFGDAWLPQYKEEWRGTNLVVSRNQALSAILREAVAAGSIVLDDLDAEAVAKSQAGNFRHRWDGLSVRLEDDARRGRAVPKKRISPGERRVPFLRRELIRLRRKMSADSHGAFADAKQRGDFNIFERRMRPLVKRMRIFYRIESSLARFPWLRRVAVAFKII